jgi:ABC-type multidrug transport system fused ATPase/permease subunit
VIAFRAPLDDNGPLPRNVFRYVAATSWSHQLLLIALTVGVFLLEVVPLELQRRAINDLARHRPYSWIALIAAVYLGSVFVQGGAKLALNIYRGWVGERAKRDLRRLVAARAGLPPGTGPAAEAQGIAAAMIVAEVEPIGNFIGASISEPLLQIGILATVMAYIIHLDPWMALAAFLIFLPQFVFVPLMQQAMNRRTRARVRILRQLGSEVVAQTTGTAGVVQDADINRVFALDMGVYRLKFTMNFLMNLGTHLQIIVAALLIGGWWVHTQRLAIGGVVAFISAITRFTDPWGDLVNYFRDVSFAQVKFRLLAEALDQFAHAPAAARPERAAAIPAE